MTEKEKREMQERIEDERRQGEKEKQKAVARTILSIVGVTGGFYIVGKTIDGDGPTQWGGILAIGAMISVLVWLYHKIIGE